VHSWRYALNFRAKNHQGEALVHDYLEGMHENKVALVTGANKGIGHAIASELAARGLTVLVGARDAVRGEAAVKRIAGDSRPITLDVTRADSIAAAATRIRRELGRLDILVNNAGIAVFGTASAASLDDIRAVFETNVFGVIAVTQALLPLLLEAPAGRIVNLSSRIGSLSVITDPAFPMRGIGGVAYGPSKSALNAITVAFAQELANTNIKVNLACPGYTATDLNGNSGPRTVSEAAQEPVRLALLGPEGPTGTFSNDDGSIPW